MLLKPLSIITPHGERPAEANGFVFTFALMTVVSSFLTFPNINWWSRIAMSDIVILDAAEHFQKMSFRNRYRISGANNAVLLTVPLVSGRDQHSPMAEVQIYNEARWQTQHWRTLVSVYKRSPYFDHYEKSLSVLFETPFTYLIDFNRAGIEWVKQQLQMGFKIQEMDVYRKDYPPGVIDLRNAKEQPEKLPKYYQVFEDRIEFVPNLSILDLLFSEGPHAGKKLGTIG